MSNANQYSNFKYSIQFSACVTFSMRLQDVEVFGFLREITIYRIFINVCLQVVVGRSTSVVYERQFEGHEIVSRDRSKKKKKKSHTAN